VGRLFTQQWVYIAEEFENRSKKNMIITEFYKQKISKEFTPYKYQLKVAEVLLSGKNVILIVPTGAGKTWASIMPFLFARENGIADFPQKMIYSLPLRTLANSIYEDVSKVTDVAIQTGEYNEDKFFEKDIIFSTIDQTLSNFLCFPLPLSHRQANINAGALIGSYLVFDEFHLLEPSLSMGTSLGMLRMLGELSRCCIMTATLSSDFAKMLKENLPNYEIITLDDYPDDKQKIKSLLPNKDKKRINVLDKTIEADDIIKNHKKKTIVICNRVENAQKLYQELITKDLTGFENLSGLKAENIICLHSRFFDKDRKAKEQRLKKLFGKEADPKEHAILISTQVIEAGMDISCSVMHTEISPINSFLQRAGRCARFENETGQIFIYDILEIDEREKISLEVNDETDKKEIRAINNKFLPYSKDIVEKSFEKLKQYPTLDGDIPKSLVENVLKESEDKNIQELNISNFNYTKILESWRDCQKNNYRSTIRDIQSVEVVLIKEDQKEEICKYPYSYQSLNMYKWSLVSWLNKITKGEGIKPYDSEDDTLVWQLVENNFLDSFGENDEDLKYKLEKITDFSQLPAQVYVNADFFGYSEGLGFNWQFEDTFGNISPKKEYKDKNEDFKPLTKDTFYQHNMGLIRCFEKEFLPKLDFAFIGLAKRIGKPEWTKAEFEQLIKLMIILHDYGKLNDQWQKPMRCYQAKKEGKELKDFNEILAHTDYDKNSPTDLALEKECELHKRGGHAGTGAFVAETVIEEYFDSEDLAYAVSMAIARHHSPLSDSYSEFSISDKSYQAIQKLFDEFRYDIKLPQKEEFEGKMNLNGLETDEQTILYLFLVRILRLCDQKATENLSNYFTGN
jgi:CRISPR-associated endonuclease/helicase Cas3